MAFGRVKALASIALLGFVLGAATNLVFSWIATNNFLKTTALSLPIPTPAVKITAVPVPVLDMLIAPWFLSGLAGSGKRGLRRPTTVLILY
jgi:hypothetical protein